MDEPTAVAQLRQLIERDKHPLVIEQKNPHHWQITGGIHVVNWYPTSRKFTAYLQGAMNGVHNATPRVVAQLAMGIGARASSEANTKARPNLGHHKRRLFKRDRRCHWCQRVTHLYKRHELTDRHGPGLLATADHRIPRSKGGSDRLDNIVLACQDCNQKRANSLGAPVQPSTLLERTADGVLDYAQPIKATEPVTHEPPPLELNRPVDKPPWD